MHLGRLPQVFITLLLGVSSFVGCMDRPPQKGNKDQLNKELAEAAKYGQIDKVRSLLDAGANANYFDGNRSVLGYAVSARLLAGGCNKHLIENYRQIVIELQNRGINLSVLDHGSTPLETALQGDCPTEMVATLLELGANPNVPDTIGFTPLHNAASRGDHFSTIMLLAAGANREAANSSRETPLIYAENRNDLDTKLVIEVLRHRPDQLLEDAIHYGVEWAVRRLVDRANVNRVYPDNMTAIGYAIQHNQPNLVRILASELDADINQRYGPQNNIPLQAARDLGRQDIVDILQEAGAQAIVTPTTSASPQPLVNRQAAEAQMRGQSGRSWLSLWWGGRGAST